jgi:hypothetical protein
MPYGDLAARLRPGFDLPVGGKTYHVPEPSAKDGLWLQALMDGAANLVLTTQLGAANKAVLSDEEERTVYQVALGAAYQQMLDDGVPWPVFKHAGTTAWVHWVRGADAGERYWATFDRDGQGKAETPVTTIPAAG